MARVADAHGAEVDGEDIERSIGGALENTAQTAHKGVGTVSGHGVDHHAAGAATGEGFHQGRRQGTDEVAVHARSLNAPLDAADEHIHSARGTEHTDAHEDSHQVGNDTDGGVEAVFGALDEGVVDVDLLAHAGHDEAYDDGHQQDVGYIGAHAVHHLALQLREAPDDGGYHRAGSAEGEQQRAAEQVDALIERGDNDTGQRREERGQKDGNEDVGRLGGTHLCTIDEDAHGNDGQSRGVEHQEHNHGIGGRVFLLVQLLHLLHGLQAEGRGGIVETQHIGGDIHKDAAGDGVPLGYLGEQFDKHRRQQARQHVDHAAALANLHDAEPEGEHARKAEGDFKRGLRRRERRVHHRRKHLIVAHERHLHQSNDEGNEEKSYPNIIQYHNACKGTAFLADTQEKASQKNFLLLWLSKKRSGCITQPLPKAS